MEDKPKAKRMTFLMYPAHNDMINELAEVAGGRMNAVRLAVEFASKNQEEFRSLLKKDIKGNVYLEQ